MHTGATSHDWVHMYGVKMGKLIRILCVSDAPSPNLIMNFSFNWTDARGFRHPRQLNQIKLNCMMM